MDLQVEAGTLLQIVKGLLLDKAEERAVYGILSDCLLTIAEEGWVNQALVEQILQHWIEGADQLAKYQLRFDFKRLESAKNLAENYQLKSTTYQLNNIISFHLEQTKHWPIVSLLEAQIPESIEDLNKLHAEKTIQLQKRQETWRSAKQLEDPETALQEQTSHLNKLEKSYEDLLEKKLLGFQLEQVRLRCNQARCKEGLEAFERSFIEVQRLVHRLIYFGQWMHAIHLYHSILTDYLTNNNILEAKGFEHKKLLQAIIDVCQNRNLFQQTKPVSYWERYQEELHTIRNQLPVNPEARNIPEVLATLTDNYRQLQDALTVLPDVSLLSGSWDKTIKHWDVERGVCLQTFTGHTNAVCALNVLPDGSLVSGSWDKTMSIQRFPTMALSLNFRLYLAQGEWQVGTHEIEWRLEKAGAWLQTMTTTLDRLLHNRLIKTEVIMEKNVIRWLIDVPVVDDNCPEDVRLNYQHQTRANAKENLIGLLKALGAKLEVTPKKPLSASPTINPTSNNHPPSLFFPSVSSNASGTTNCNDETSISVNQLRK